MWREGHKQGPGCQASLVDTGRLEKRGTLARLQALGTAATVLCTAATAALGVLGLRITSLKNYAT